MLTHEQIWTEVFASRQNRGIIKWPVVGVEEHQVRLKDGEILKVPCLVAQKGTVKGIIPMHESGITEGENKKANKSRLNTLIGQDISIIVTGIIEENDIFIASRKAAMEELSRRVWDTLEVGQVKKAIIRRTYRGSAREDGKKSPDGAYVEFDGIEAVLPIYEISHGWVEEIRDTLQPGTEVVVKVIRINKDKKRCQVSMKALLPNPWPDVARRIQRKGVYAGKVTGIARYGVFVNFEPGVDILCRHNRNGIYPEVGDMVRFEVEYIDIKEQKIKGIIRSIINRVS